MDVTHRIRIRQNGDGKGRRCLLGDGIVSILNDSLENDLKKRNSHLVGDLEKWMNGFV